MTRIDFYILKDAHPDAADRFVCRLVNKAWRQGNRIFVHTASDQDSRRLDELLWTFPEEGFLPHALWNGQTDTSFPVFIGQAEPPAPRDLLINLGPAVPPWYPDFARVAEIVAGDDAAKQAGRGRFRYYRQQGLEPESHTL